MPGFRLAFRTKNVSVAPETKRYLTGGFANLGFSNLFGNRLREATDPARRTHPPGVTLNKERTHGDSISGHPAL